MSMYKKGRNEEIVNRYDKGETVRELGRIYGISFQRVQQIIKAKEVSEMCRQRKLDKIACQALRKFLEDSNMNLSTLAAQKGLSYQTLRTFARGDIITLSSLARIAKATNIPIQDLAGSFKEVGNA